MVSALPIVQRELLVRSRDRLTWWVRTMVAAAGCGIAFLMVLVAAGSSDPGVGLTLHVALGGLAWLFCLVEGIRHTVDGLSEEKRQGTLGLLFLTDLRGYDVVLGKFAAAGLTTYCGLAGLLPPLAVPITLGGVTGVEFGRLAIALVNTLFFTLSAGTFVSALSRHELRAVLWGTLLVLGLTAAPGLWAMLPGSAPALPSPWQVFYHSFAATYAADLFWTSNALLFGVGILLLAVTSLVLPRSWREGGPARAPRWRRRGVVAAAGESARRRRDRARWLATNPLQWLVLRDSYERPWLWTLVIVACAGAAGAWLMQPGSSQVAWIVLLALQGVHFAVNCWVASAATRTLSEARQSGALELILSTPLPSRQIVRGLRLALRHMFFAPVLVLVVTEVALFVVHVAMQVGTGGATEKILLAALVVATSTAVFLCDLVAVANLGMWMGLTRPTAASAVFRTLLYALILPLPLLPCGCVGPWLWLSKSLVILTWAQTSLNQHFRTAASGQHDPPPAR